MMGTVTESRRARPVRRDRGMVTLEILILFPALLGLVMFVAQVALLYFAKQAALAAAEQGVRVAAADGTVADPYAGVPQGIQAAKDFAATTSGSILTIGPSGVTSPAPNPATNQIQITVTGKAANLISIINLNVSQTAQGSVEKFTSLGSP